jgi:prepilin-type processing-associated H-X9-DG protein
MFGGALEADQRPLNAYVRRVDVFRSPADKGEPLWWFDTAAYQATATCYELYGSSYYYASGFNRIGGVMMPMGIARCVGVDLFWNAFVQQPLPLGAPLRLTSYSQPARKVVVGSIPIHRTMSGLVAVNARARWYRNDTDHLWANAAFLDGHVELVNVFPYDPGYPGISTVPDAANPYY